MTIDDAIAGLSTLSSQVDVVLAQQASLKTQLAAALANAVDQVKINSLVDSINASVAKLKTV